MLFRPRYESRVNSPRSLTLGTSRGAETHVEDYMQLMKFIVPLIFKVNPEKPSLERELPLGKVNPNLGNLSHSASFVLAGPDVDDVDEVQQQGILPGLGIISGAAGLDGSEQFRHRHDDDDALESESPDERHDAEQARGHGAEGPQHRPDHQDERGEFGDDDEAGHHRGDTQGRHEPPGGHVSGAAAKARQRHTHARAQAGR